MNDFFEAMPEAGMIIINKKIRTSRLKALRSLFLMRGEIVVFQLSEIYYKAQLCLICD